MTFSTLHSYVIPRLLCIPNIPYMFVGVLLKYPGVMSFECRRSFGNVLYHKMWTPKPYIILKKIITKEITYTQTATKSINLFNAYERLKSPPPFTVHFLLVDFTKSINLFNVFNFSKKLKNACTLLFISYFYLFI